MRAPKVEGVREWMTPAEAADYLRIGITKLRALEVPRHRLGHRTVVYRRSDLDAYAESKREAA